MSRSARPGRCWWRRRCYISSGGILMGARQPYGSTFAKFLGTSAMPRSVVFVCSFGRWWALWGRLTDWTCSSAAIFSLVPQRMTCGTRPRCPWWGSSQQQILS
jgi:hypothetical protein